MHIPQHRGLSTDFSPAVRLRRPDRDLTMNDGITGQSSTYPQPVDRLVGTRDSRVSGHAVECHPQPGPGTTSVRPPHGQRDPLRSAAVDPTASGPTFRHLLTHRTLRTSMCTTCARASAAGDERWPPTASSCRAPRRPRAVHRADPRVDGLQRGCPRYPHRL